MVTMSEENFPKHVEIVAAIIRCDAETAVEDAARCGLRYAEVRRPVKYGTAVYHWAVAAIDKVVAELKAVGYTTGLNTRPACSHPAQQYDPNRKDWIVMTLTIKW